MTDIKTVSTAAFQRQSAKARHTAIAAATILGMSATAHLDGLGSPQERGAGLAGAIAAGHKKMPAAVASVAGKGGDASKVSNFINDCAAAWKALESAGRINNQRCRDLKNNLRKACNGWARDSYKGFEIKSPKGAGLTAYVWAKIEEPSPAAPVDSPNNPEEENNEKAKAKLQAESRKAEQSALKKGELIGQQESAETIAKLQAELNATRILLAKSIAAEARALHMAVSYAQGKPVTGKQLGAVKTGIRRAHKAAAAAAKLAETTVSLPPLPMTRKAAATAKQKAA